MKFFDKRNNKVCEAYSIREDGNKIFVKFTPNGKEYSYFASNIELITENNKIFSSIALLSSSSSDKDLNFISSVSFNIDKLYFNLDRMKFFKSINQNNLSEKCIYDFIINYFKIYYKLKYNLKNNIKCKELKRMLIVNSYHIATSCNFNIKEKLLMIMFLINDKFYYSRLEKRDYINE